MASNQVEIVFRALADPKLGSLFRISQKSTSQQDNRQSVQSAQPAKTLAEKQKAAHPPLLTHWAVKVTLEVGCYGYDAGAYYYGLVTEDKAPELCVIDTTIWESMGNSSQRFRGLTSQIPPELFIKGA